MPERLVKFCDPGLSFDQRTLDLSFWAMFVPHPWISTVASRRITRRNNDETAPRMFFRDTNLKQTAEQIMFVRCEMLKVCFMQPKMFFNKHKIICHDTFQGTEKGSMGFSKDSEVGKTGVFVVQLNTVTGSVAQEVTMVSRGWREERREGAT